MIFRIILIFMLIPVIAKAQTTWNKVYDNPLIDANGYGALIPSGFFLWSDHVSIVGETNACIECESISQLLFMNLNYNGDIEDSTFHFEPTDEIYRMNASSNYKGMFKNENDLPVGVIFHFPDTSDARPVYHNSLYHFDADLNILDIDTIFGLSSETDTFHLVYQGINSSSGYLLSGRYHEKTELTEDSHGFIAKVNKEDGSLIWKKKYESLYEVRSMQEDEDGNIYAMATTPVNAQYVFLKLDSLGNILKQYEFGGLGRERDAYFLLEEDRIVLGGFLANDTLYEDIEVPDGEDIYYDPGDGTYFTRIIHETSTGFVEEQTKRYGVDYIYYDQDAAGIFPYDSGYILYGTYRQPITPYQRGLIINLNQNLDTNWTKLYAYYTQSEDTDHWLRYVEPLPDGGFIGCGYVKNDVTDPFPLLEQLWLFRTDEYGCIEPGCQDVNVDEILVGLENVMSVYPNPAREFVTVEFDFPAGYSPPNSGEFRLMSMDGKEVLRKEVSAGVFDSPLRLDVSDLKAGVYVLHWTDGKKWMDSVRIITN